MFEVYKKELKELLRDKKTLMFVVALPVLIFPIIFAVMAFISSQAALEADQKVNTYVIINGEYAPEFTNKVFYHKSFELYKGSKTFNTIEELKAGVTAGDIDMGIYLPSNAEDTLDSGEQSKWEVVFNDAKSINFLFDRVKELAQEYSDVLQAKKLKSFGIEESTHKAILTPIEVVKVDTADKRENLGEKIGGFLPYLLIPLVLMGATYPAIDLGAGEKERGTLETLLLTPITRTELVLGKFITLLTTSIASTTITVVSMGCWVAVALAFADLDFIKTAFSTLAVTDLLMIFVLLLPLAAIFSSLALAISIYARTFKEAQNYMAPLSMGVFFPIIISIMPNMELTAKTAFIPVTNVALAIKDIIKGTVDYTFVGLIFLATALIAGALLAFCVKWFNREDVLFR
ncbi:sodium ABC transporter permease [Pseudoalteromonas sp. 13-15]|jgi:sodium transport system permease protein|uniref:ABC transporter permease n=1 Tax=Pseudoalteromonas TaxID=53246 RepID=UPI0000EAC2F3|nr:MULTISPECIES: ABC transporter permease [Pseudoalteromonas]EAW27772.1 putative ABC-type Na+ efflux pump, permease component [Alteromonadales bacterium TW-7]MBL1386778.1 ABC transporter permease [Colwellia sp.]ATG58295.1 ABC transporter permease [Pseudoalteromonas marina]AUL72716.1 sodium ABC transporter permease [Pseudoalteromonas sp. 13-15]TMS80285.1 ABC transporter permease [Pseudoalteromonas sp. S554]|tara:strand:- start:124 stop:1332 length:1209 start_codon:yes stop_codon:yes gene_type:complete